MAIDNQTIDVLAPTVSVDVIVSKADDFKGLFRHVRELLYLQSRRVATDLPEESLSIHPVFSRLESDAILTLGPQS